MKLVSVEKIKQKAFSKIKFDENSVFGKMFSELTESAKILVYGPPKSGKSTLALALANVLASVHNKRVAYIAAEEITKTGISYSLARRIELLGITSKNIMFCEKFDKESLFDAMKYDVIVIDSYQACGLKIDDWKDILNANGERLIIVVSQLNNKGKNNLTAIEHDVDVVSKVVKGIVTTESRFLTSPTTVQFFSKSGKIQTANLF